MNGFDCHGVITKLEKKSSFNIPMNWFKGGHRKWEKNKTKNRANYQCPAKLSIGQTLSDPKLSLAETIHLLDPELISC